MLDRSESFFNAQRFMGVILHNFSRSAGSCLTCCFQAAVYGIGICAEFGGSAFRPHTGGMCFTYCKSDYFIVTFCCWHWLFVCAEALSRLYNVIKHPNALDLDNAMAYDNSVSALGKICQFHRDSINASQVSYEPYAFITPQLLACLECVVNWWFNVGNIEL